MSPARAWSRSRTYPASRSARPKRVRTYEPPTTMMPRYTRKNSSGAPVDRAATSSTTAATRSWTRRTIAVYLGPTGRRRTLRARATGDLDRHAVEQLANDQRRVNVAHRSRGLDDRAVGERRDRERLDVVGDDVVATQQRGIRLPGAVQPQRAARRRAEIDVGMVARGCDQANDVLAHLRVHIDVAHGRLHLLQLLARDDFPDLVDRPGAL